METIAIDVGQIITAIVLPIILLNFILPWRRHPLLDWSFILKQLGFTLIIGGWLSVKHFQMMGPETYEDFNAFVWTFVAIAELFVLYCLYRERYVGKFRRCYNRLRRRANGTSTISAV